MKTNKLFPILLVSIIANAVLAAFLLAPQITKFKNARAGIGGQNKAVVSNAATQDNIFDEINPVEGFTIKASYGNLGQKMTASGVIDLAKFKETYEKSNSPLTEEQLGILEQGSDKNITINRENSYFLLNFFWAMGLANKSSILDEGDMIKYGGKEGAGSFASTGGWTLSKSKAMNYYSKSSLIPLTKEQEALVYEVTSNIFRPCCNNSTAFPDCNHGMALLAVMQLMASNGATEKEMYEAGKYFNAYWFPGNYYDLAMYFKNKDGKSFKDMDAKTVLSREYSSASGAQSIKKWLVEKGLVQQPPKTGGGCGV